MWSIWLNLGRYLQNFLSKLLKIFITERFKMLKVCKKLYQLLNLKLLKFVNDCYKSQELMLYYKKLWKSINMWHKIYQSSLKVFWIRTLFVITEFQCLFNVMYLLFIDSSLSTTLSTPMLTSRRPSSSLDSPLTTPVTSQLPMTSPLPKIFTWRWTRTSFSNFINNLKWFRSNWMRLSDQELCQYSDTPIIETHLRF